MADMPFGIAIPQRGPSPTPSSSIVSASPASSSRPSGMTPSSSYTPNPFEFAVPSIPPRLSRVGRRISEMGMNVLVGADFPDEQPMNRREPPKQPAEVPGMGDEPIMCPFCNKPLPPAFILTQMAHNHANSQEKKRTIERKSSLSTRRPGEISRSASGTGAGPMGMTRIGESSGPASVSMSSAASMPTPGLRRAVSSGPTQLSGISLTAAKSTPDLSIADQLDETTRPKPGEILPKATAESLLPMVKSAETADTAGASTIISQEDVRKWSSIAGINLPNSDLSTNTPIPPPAAPPKPEKAIPALPPPPPPSSTVAGRLKKPEQPASGSSGFGGMFKRGGAKNKAEESDDDDDDFGAMGGYAKLNGPASPDGEEPPAWIPKTATRGNETANDSGPEVEDVERAGSGPDHDKVAVMSEEPKSIVQTASDEALKMLLVEVLGKVNNMSKSHEDLLHSHTTLLTSLKIARSNLAMAEANSEMLEEQLKRNPPAPVRPAPQRQASTRPSTPSIPVSAPPPIRPATSVPSINIPARKSLDEARPLPSVSGPRRSEDGRPARPSSMYIPPTGSYGSGAMTGPAMSSSAKESKGMFGFLGGGKTKVPGLGTIILPSAKEIQASAVRFGDSIAGNTPSGTPTREAGQFFDYHVPSQYGPVQNERRANGEPISRSSSPNPNNNSNLAPPSQSPVLSTSMTSPPTLRPQPISPALSAELAKLRTAYTTSQTRMDAMNKELTELKKGKLEMEAELESLSQALFEEANKMVSEERKRRAEVEESLKEVKEEREALRETIKVLGGQADVRQSEETPRVEISSTRDEKKGDDFMPRDLDKHYEALRKTIHHVADGTAPTAAFEQAVGGDGSSVGRVSADSIMGGNEDVGRKISTGSAGELNPWAEVDFGTKSAGGMSINRGMEDLDGMDPLAKMPVNESGSRDGAAAEMERGG